MKKQKSQDHKKERRPLISR